jgi:hypothetical protein
MRITITTATFVKSTVVLCCILFNAVNNGIMPICETEQTLEQICWLQTLPIKQRLTLIRLCTAFACLKNAVGRCMHTYISIALHPTSETKRNVVQQECMKQQQQQRQFSNPLGFLSLYLAFHVGHPIYISRSFDRPPSSEGLECGLGL